MEVIEITVKSEQCFNLPSEPYANSRPAVSLTATVAEGENIYEATRQLQEMAESYVQICKDRTLRRINDEQKRTPVVRIEFDTYTSEDDFDTEEEDD